MTAIAEPAHPDQNEYVVPPWWQVVLLASAPIILGIALLGAYFWNFAGRISDKQDVWGQFGDFVGGVLNPVIAWMTLIAVAISLRFTVHALRETATATRIALRQYEHELREQGDRRLQERDARLKELTFQMHQLWVAPGMQEIRREAMTSLRSAIDMTDVQEGASSPVFLGDYRMGGEQKSRRAYYMLRGVWEFLADINTLISKNMLDAGLTFQLFGASIEPWVVLNERVDLRESPEDAAQESLDENRWFQERVRPLGGLLQYWQDLARPNPPGHRPGVQDSPRPPAPSA